MEKLNQIWPNKAQMTRDIAELCSKNPAYAAYEVKYVTVQAWFKNEKVPWWWFHIIKGAAELRGHELTDEDMAAICPK